MGELNDQIKALNEKLAKKGHQVEMNMRTVVTNAALRIERSAKLLMKNTTRVSEGTRNPSGSMARHRVGKFRHLPSAPGFAPAPDTGRLVQSVTHTVAEDGNSARIGTAVFYGKILEYGSSRMSPRPWLRPAIDQNRAKIKADFAKMLPEASIEVESEGGATP